MRKKLSETDLEKSIQELKKLYAGKIESIRSKLDFQLNKCNKINLLNFSESLKKYVPKHEDESRFWAMCVNRFRVNRNRKNKK